MATLIFDIDGTIVHHHTREWLPGVKEKLIALVAAGHVVLFVTKRGWRRADGTWPDDGTAWSKEETAKLLGELPFPTVVCYGVGQPRILIDDEQPSHIKTERNSGDWLARLDRMEGLDVSKIEKSLLLDRMDRLAGLTNGPTEKSPPGTGAATA